MPKTVGKAVTRNQLKRRLRSGWSELGERVPRGRDYVLVARPGIADAAEAREHEWLLDRLDEVLGKSAT